jgi:ribonucleoside-diphosphate reductase alpha chain
MKVVKRNGNVVDLSFDKVLWRLRKLVKDKNLGTLENVEADIISHEVIKNIYDGVKTSELDEVASRIAISYSTEHPEYGVLASRVIISNMHKNTSECFSEAIETLGKKELVSQEIVEIVRKHKNILNDSLDYSRDYLFDYFGYKTIERSYLLKVSDTQIIERPQHMWMRVSLGIHKQDIVRALETYNLMSQFYFTHASPTLFNSGTNRPSMSSCFLLGINDSMDGIYKCLRDCAMISKNAGGIGVHVSNIRSKGSYIKGTNGKSDGLVKMLKVFNETARFANQGSKRNGSFAIYLEPHHADIFEFLELRKNTGDETMRARDLFYAMWISDLFMECVENNGDWYLMSEDTSPGLTDVYGEEYRALYNKYVTEGNYRKKIKARDLWQKILVSQIETGMPYMSYKDSINEKCNQKNIGVVKSSNLCNEITLVSDDTETAVCNICTFSLSKFLERDHLGGFVYNHQRLYEVVKIATRNMNNVIDYNFYPTPEARKSNTRHRPIAMGIQGLANLFFEMGIPFESDTSRQLNLEIMETIQFAGWEASMLLSKESGKAYETFPGSPISKGIFQHNMWGFENDQLSGRWNWNVLKEQVMKYGVMNSMITSLPPTASTSQILGNYESFEPQNSNMFMRSTLSGDFPIINKWLVQDLVKLGIWNTEMKNQIITNSGSVQNITGIPESLKKIYKTIWEIPQKVLLEMSADRARFVDQTQSLNVYMASPTIAKLSSMHFYAWKLKLKTGMYYLRSKPASNAQQFSIQKNTTKTTIEEQLICSIDNRDACQSCSG